MPLPYGVFGPFGQISEKSLRNWIEPHKEKLIGWYSSRRHYKTPKPSLTDIFVHFNLLDLVIPEHFDTFLFGSLTTTSSYPFSTHNYHYAFHTFNRQTRSFVEFPLKICNLSDRTNDSAGCLESCLYPEARNFRKLSLDVGPR